MAGRRVLVLTIDPARRLAEAMGIPESGATPSKIDAARLAEAGVPAPGALYAWMLDPRIIFSDMVRRLAKSEEQAKRILDNRLYGVLSELIAGMQEYTAAEALHSLWSTGQYDLIVLDTPPARNAIEFLDGPGKLAAFLDERVVGLFLPQTRGAIWQRATHLIGAVFSRVFGEGFFRDIQEFLSLFSGMFGPMREHSLLVRKLLQSDDAAFILVTTPEPSALAEVAFFRNRLKSKNLPFAGYVLNRSWAYTRGFAIPTELPMPLELPPYAAEASRKLMALVEEENLRARVDRDLLHKLRAQSDGGFATATPHLGEGVEDLRGLVTLAHCLVQPSTLHG
jgi:anion-transporting  ArsA/GET3 family ATPase